MFAGVVYKYSTIECFLEIFADEDVVDQGRSAFTDSSQSGYVWNHSIIK